MTAHAMAGDVEKSLAAGMNAHVVKPIEPEALFETIQMVLGLKPKATSKIGQSQKVKEEPPTPLDAKSLMSIDKQQAIKALHNEPGLYEELLTDFINLEDKAHALKRALTEQDLVTIRDVVHAYKPSLSYIGAYSLALSAKELEINLKAANAPLSIQQEQQVQTFLEAVLQLTQQLKQGNR
jgi:CheY-like chemotaxis protein